MTQLFFFHYIKIWLVQYHIPLPLTIFNHAICIYKLKQITGMPLYAGPINECSLYKLCKALMMIGIDWYAVSVLWKDVKH